MPKVVDAAALAANQTYLNRCWVALAGVGCSGGIVLGGGVAYLTLFNVGNPSRSPIHCLVTTARAGGWVGVDIGHAVAFVSGCDDAAVLNNRTFTGWDWQFSLGGRYAEAIKTGKAALRPLLQLVKIIICAPKSAPGEIVKNLVENIIRGWRNYDDAKQPNFIMLSTFVGGGVGLGVFYEAQTLHTSGATLWEVCPPSWKLELVGGEVQLFMEDIPMCGPSNSDYCWGEFFLELVDRDFESAPIAHWGAGIYRPARDPDCETLGQFRDDTLQRADVKDSPLRSLFHCNCGLGELIRCKDRSPSKPLRRELAMHTRAFVAGCRSFNNVRFTGYGGEKVIELALRAYEVNYGAKASKRSYFNDPNDATPGKLLWESQDYCRVQMSADGRMQIPLTTAWLH